MPDWVFPAMEHIQPSPFSRLRRSYFQLDSGFLHHSNYPCALLRRSCISLPGLKCGSRAYAFIRLSRFSRTLYELERRCPDYVDVADWQMAIEDGGSFLRRWAEQAEALGWTARDLFGLAPAPDKAAANYRRLSRYDLTGLIWLLRGRSVVALTEATAAIKHPRGAVTTYRRHNKPAFGPIGDSLDYFVA